MKKTKFKLKRKKRIILSVFLFLLLTFSYQAAHDFTGEQDREASIPIQDETIPADTSDAYLKVHFIDVGQADSILIESDGHYMLIDSGNRDDSKTVTAYLQAQGAEHLDYVIGTHPHEDHIGSLSSIIDTFPIDTIIMPPKTHTTKFFSDAIASLEKENLSITVPVVGQTYQLGDASFIILGPNKDYGDNLNNWSVGIRLDYGDNSFIFCGDAEKTAELDIINTGISLKADVLKLNHHGSSTSTSQTFLDAVAPTYTVILCGQNNKYGLPHAETMEKLQAADITVFRTDEQGNIVAASDGKTIWWSYGTDTAAAAHRR